ncbi:MAG: flagellar FliJ family protein [Chloroflexota bacterium]
MKTGFRLAVVLRLREMAEDAARAKLGAAAADYRKATEIVAKLHAREDEARGRMLELQDGGGMAGDIVASVRGIEMAEQQTAIGRQALEIAARALVDARSALAEASRRREVVQRLRDRQRQAEVLEAQRHEDSVLSELAGVRHARGLGAEKDQ